MTSDNVVKTKRVAMWFAIFKITIPITLVPIVGQIISVCASLSNLRKPLLTH